MKRKENKLFQLIFFLKNQLNQRRLKCQFVFQHQSQILFPQHLLRHFQQHQQHFQKNVHFPVHYHSQRAISYLQQYQNESH